MEFIELVCRAKTGDTEAQGALYEASYKRVYYLALRLTKNPEDAEDATQEAFIAAFAALPNLQNDNAFEGWLFQIAANKCRNKLARTKQTDELPEDFAEHTPELNENFLPEAVLQDAEKRRLILEIIENLPDAQRECVMLFYYSEMSVKQISEVLDCSEGTVKSRLNYARQKIKDGILDTEERDGIRLHTFIPIGLLLAQDFAEATAGLTITALGGAAGAGAAAGGTATVKAGLLATVKAKIIAGVAAVAVVGGSVAAVVSQMPDPIVFSDPAMEQNIRIIIDKPEGKLYPEDVEELYSVYIFDDGMAKDDWEGGYQGNTAQAGTVPVDSLADLKNLKNLHTIHYSATDMRLLNTIGDNENITMLGQYTRDMNRSALQDLTFLDRLPNLTQLNATIADGTDISPVERRESLQELILQSDGSLRLELDGLPRLLYLSVHSNYLGTNPGAAIALVLTQELPELRLLALGSNSVSSISFLAHMPAIASLDLYADNMEQLDLQTLGSLKALRAIMLSGSYDDTIDLSGLSACPLLEVYIVSNGNAINAPSHASTDTDSNLPLFNRVNVEIQDEIHRLMFGEDEDE